MWEAQAWWLEKDGTQLPVVLARIHNLLIIVVNQGWLLTSFDKRSIIGQLSICWMKVGLSALSEDREFVLFMDLVSYQLFSFFFLFILSSFSFFSLICFHVYYKSVLVFYVMICFCSQWWVISSCLSVLIVCYLGNLYLLPWRWWALMGDTIKAWG